MKNLADARWIDLLAVFAVTAVILIAVNLIRDQVILSSTSLISLLIAGALVTAALAYAKRRAQQ